MAGPLEELRRPEVEAVVEVAVVAGLLAAALVVGDLAVKAKQECDQVLAELHRIPGL